MIGDFLGRATAVDFGGRHFVCRRATLGTVLRTLDLFADYIAAGSTVEAPGVDPTEVICQAVKLQPMRTAYVLESCVDGAPGEIVQACAHNPDLCEALVRGVLSITNLPRIVETLDLDTLASDEHHEQNDAPIPLERSIVDMAQRFGQTPEQVTCWAFEQFLGVQDCLSTDQEQPQSEFMQMAERMAREHAKA